MASYDRLSGLDELFLGFETANAYMHVAVTAVFERGPLCKPGGGVDIERLRQHVATRLPGLPRFRQRIGYLPLVRDAMWVDDDRFDLVHHVRHASLPRPGSSAQLRQRCAEILERPLNRRRPLWEMWAIEGLADDAFALVVKVHHCVVDGIAGIGVLAALLDVEAAPAPGVVVPWRPRRPPTTRELMRDEVARRMRGTLAAGRAMGQALTDPVGGVGQIGSAAKSLWRLLRTGLSPAPMMCINRPLGPHRELAWLALDLERVKAIRRRLEGTVNDIVLTLVSGALGSVLRRRGELPRGEPLRAAVPVSVRTAEEIGAPGNRVSIWLVPLPVADRNVRRRLATIRATTAELKRGGQAAGGSVLAEAANWAGGAVVEAAARVINATRIYNLIVTNVPGPAVPLYLGGSRMREVYPHLPLFEQQGIGIALLSYLGTLYVGITADWNLSDVLGELTERFESGFAELAEVAGLDDDAGPAHRPATVVGIWRQGVSS
ncbi:MAG TPA: wax ester/triacylglycerol synthase family O-acyltransferase [Candidatus Eisenbacteria bacterium]|nr:wax ester/triacylglycerol synthase family O-acyltransferase [Candidatus Eisenbacteria bacterium]